MCIFCAVSCLVHFHPHQRTTLVGRTIGLFGAMHFKQDTCIESRMWPNSLSERKALEKLVNTRLCNRLSTYWKQLGRYGLSVYVDEG